MATLALFLAAGGGAYAAVSLPANSVGTKQLQKGAVTRAKLHKGAVTGSKVAPQSLTGAQINASTLGTVPNATHAGTADRIPPLKYVRITLTNGWIAFPGHRPPEYAVDAQGIVHFEGSIARASGTSIDAFVMPKALTPGTNINLAAEQSGGDIGRIQIFSSGVVGVEDDPDHHGSSTTFTSLEGISYMSGG